MLKLHLRLPLPILTLSLLCFAPVPSSGAVTDFSERSGNCLSFTLLFVALASLYLAGGREEAAKKWLVRRQALWLTDDPGRRELLKSRLQEPSGDALLSPD